MERNSPVWDNMALHHPSQNMDSGSWRIWLMESCIFCLTSPSHQIATEIPTPTLLVRRNEERKGVAMPNCGQKPVLRFTPAAGPLISILLYMVYQPKIETLLTE